MPLSDTAIKNAKPTPDKAFKMPDGKGMYLLVNPSGSKYFRFDYRFDGKRKTLALGVYPDTSLKQAREAHDKAREQLAQGIDPSENKKAAKVAQSHTFEHVTRAYLTSIAHTVRDVTHQKKLRRFELHTFPCIGNLAISDIKSPDIYNILKPIIAKKGLETAHRVHSEISAAFSYAIAHGFTDYDPAQAVAAQIPPQKVKHRAALTEPQEVAQLLRDIFHYQGTFVVQCALRLSPILFQRPGEIRQMEWKDVDLDVKEWRYFVTKTEVLHIVPLSTQAVAILKEIRPLTGSGRYVFPSSRGDGRPMSDGTIRTALKTLGYDSDVMTAHGFRTTASTLLNEQGWGADAIERQLCHMPRDAVRAAYNRAQYLDERRRMMQSWADYLDGLKAGGLIVPFRNTG
jgi:integrase